MHSKYLLRAAIVLALPLTVACGNSDRNPVDGDAIVIGDTDAGSGDAAVDVDGGQPACADNTERAALYIEKRYMLLTIIDKENIDKR